MTMPTWTRRCVAWALLATVASACGAPSGGAPNRATLEGHVTASASPTKRFLWAESGHGWSLVQEGPQPDSALTPVGRAVIGWTTGDYAG